MAESCDRNQKHPVLAVVGPTATGKTALGVALAEAFEGEVISADSMQIYKGLDVGTAKVAPEETHGIPHHAVDILEPDEPFSVADFVALAGTLEADISARGRLPILVGGTGLYVQSFLYGVRFAAEKTPDGLREQLAAELVEAGADGIVTGVLTPEGELDVDALRPIYAAARAAAKAAGRPVVCTLHRAFDVCKDPFAALEAAKALNLGTILTSGQAASAPAGASLLRRLVEAAGPDLEILVGAGVTPANLPALAAETGAHAFHMSGKQVLDSRMTFRREGVPMGLPGFSEFDIWQTSEETIRAARRVLNEL